MVDFKQVIINFLFSGSLIAALGFLLKDFLNEKVKLSVAKNLEVYKRELDEAGSRKAEKWKLKREACLESLSIAEAALSHMEWPGLDSNKIIKQDIDTIKFRECYNKLVCSCDDASILTMFKTLVGLKGTEVRTDLIMDFRNAIRKELGFGEELDQDRETTFFGWVASDYRHLETPNIS